MTNATRLASRARWLSSQLTTEAMRWPRGEVRSALRHSATQLSYQARIVEPKPTDSVPL